MNKSQLIKEVSNCTGFSQSACEMIVNSVLNNITYELSKGNSVSLSDFGVFKPKYRKERIGRNPHTGKRVPIPARTMPTFQPDKKLKEVVINGN